MALPFNEQMRAVLDELRDGIVAVLGGELLGLYLYGSLTTGDFTEGVSDVDLLAATAADLTDGQLDGLREMHAAFVRRRPQWDDRIEVAYFSTRGLRTFRTERSPLGIISPGEPLHRLSAGEDWLMNWYLVRSGGVTLLGPPPETLIPPVSTEEYVAAVRAHAGWMRDAPETRRSVKEQSYTIITLSRALYTVRHGEHVSKQQAAVWAKEQLAAWSGLIDRALAWRTDPAPRDDPDVVFPETSRFVQEVCALIEMG
jgi:hypothetical protein